VSATWSDWRPLALAGGAPDARVLAEILDGGQAFRWWPSRARPEPGEGNDPSFLGHWSDCVAEVRLHRGTLEWRAPSGLEAHVAAAIGPYFAADRDFGALADSLPWRSDAHLAACLRAFPGLRLLRQPFGETLLGFLCSATKQIVQIKQMLALLAERHGAAVGKLVGSPLAADHEADPALRKRRPYQAAIGRPPSALCPPPSRSLPSWEKLARIPERELRACLLGFRARFIHQTARFLAAEPGWLEATERLPYAEAKERLRLLPGVGEKIADCVLLFGAGRLEAFPVDVWILRVMTERYGLRGWKPAQIAHFGRTHFGPLAGLAQQYLFAQERRGS
jgi:N-glycosylase/DNA lyase